MACVDSDSFKWDGCASTRESDIRDPYLVYLVYPQLYQELQGENINDFVQLGLGSDCLLDSREYSILFAETKYGDDWRE